MSDRPAFKITYWGTTGTFCDPLLPRQVTDKIVEAIRCLVEKGRLADLQPGPNLKETIGTLLADELPFWRRSTYGGNTTCVEVETPETHFILDCGSGFRELGNSLQARWKAQGDAARRVVHVLVTHAHMDHTFATPYFSPYYDKRNAVSVWGTKIPLDSLTAVLDPKSAMSQIYFPPTYNEMRGLKCFNMLTPGCEITIGATRILTQSLNHPGGAIAYRLENAGRVFVFATDHEHPESPDPALARFAKGADLLYTEGQYTQAEYAGEIGISDDPPMSRRGWGHSAVETCIATAVFAGVRRLHIGHRDPRRNDPQIAEFAEYVHRVLEGELHKANRPLTDCEAIIPYEGMQVSI